MYFVFQDCYENLINYGNEIYSLVKGKLSKNYKFPIDDMTRYIITNNGKTTTLEGDEFMQEKYKDWETTISKQDISQQRMYLNPVIFKDMNQDSIKDIYSRSYNELNTFKGYLVCATDGMTVELPNHSIPRKEWAVPENSLNYTNPSRARTSGFFDLRNGFIIDSIIEKTNIGELPLALRNIENVSQIFDFKNIISIYDRGYPSIELFMKLIEKQGMFIVRLKSDDYKTERSKMKKNDEFVKITLNKTRTNRIKDSILREKAEKKTILKLRIVNIKLPNGTIETLITNLPKKIANKDELKELYAERWGIETDNDILKNKLHIENFSGLKEIIIKQDFYSQIFMHNMLNEYRLHINLNMKLKKEEKGNYKEYKTNINVLAGKLKGLILKVFFAENEEERRKINNYILETAEKNMILIKKKESSPRERKYGKNKNSINLRKNF